MSINVSTYSVISTFIPGDEGTSRVMSQYIIPSQSNSELMSGQVMEMKA